MNIVNNNNNNNNNLNNTNNINSNSNGKLKIDNENFEYNSNYNVYNIKNGSFEFLDYCVQENKTCLRLQMNDHSIYLAKCHLKLIKLVISHLKH